VRLPALAADPIAEGLSDGLVMTDLLGRITYANERMARMSGYPRADLLGMSVDLLVPEPIRIAHGHQRFRFHAEGRTRPMGARLDTRLLRKDGTEHAVQIQLSPAEIGGERGILAAIRDVAEVTRAEQLLRDHEHVLTIVAERERIAVEVNAGVIHTLFGIGLHLQAVVEHTRDEGARKAMEGVVEELDRAITELREHIFRHRSQTFDG